MMERPVDTGAGITSPTTLQEALAVRDAVPEERCKTCRFWGSRVDDWSGYSACRRYPPTNKEHPHVAPVAIWPKTSGDQWCGEWQARDGEG